MSTKKLRPWTEVVKLHPDVEAGALTEAVFAIDLGAIASNDPNVPLVNRDPVAFFRATYLTAELRKLLQEVLAALSGRADYNRVVKLRTPFGGGKSHTLAALLHAVRARKGLKASPDVEEKGKALFVKDEEDPDYGKPAILRKGELPDPGRVDVAVFDGEKFDAKSGKKLDDGRTIRTMWGWIAWQLGPEKYAIVEEHDRDRVSPGGDVIKDMLEGGPKLILLDEVLKYMERASGEAVLESTLQRQAKDFFQNLTVEVAGSANAALVYSLTWSAREALGNVALLQEVDKLASRVDQLREPVQGDEILPILQRRLLAEPPSEEMADEVAAAYASVVAGMWRADADTPVDRERAERESHTLRERLKAAYPFHPALIDIMRERWASLDAFQRTRGALRFLAACLHSLKAGGGAQAILGPAEVPVGDPEVRVKLLKELGLQNEYDAVITADIEGPNARAGRIDERLARETPALAGVRPATRLATAVLTHSFGGLRRNGGGEAETLPPGVTEDELLASCIGPHLDSLTARAALTDLKTSCLYLHYDGVRYCFRKDPNVTKLIEDAEQDIVRNPEAVRERVKEMLEKRLAGRRDAVVWPERPDSMPDCEPLFLVGYAPLEVAGEAKAEREGWAREVFSRHGDRPRRYRNGLCLAMPEKKQIEALRRAVRYLLAIERVEATKRQHRLTRDQLDQLKERRQTEEAAAESAFRKLYSSVWLPRIEGGEVAIEAVEVGGKPLQATSVHERVWELLTTSGTPKVHSKVTPKKLAERVKLGDPDRPGVPASEVRDAFYEVIEPPRLASAEAICKAVAEGVASGLFAYTSGATPSLGPEGVFQVSPDKVTIGTPIPVDEVDLESGFLMVPSAVPQAKPVEVGPGAEEGKPEDVTGVSETEGETGPSAEGRKPGLRKAVRMRFSATRDQVFKAFPAIANLADKSDDGRVQIDIEATSQAGYDPSWLRNAVEEPLDEADIEPETPSL